MQYKKIAIIVSARDPAGMNIKDQLLELYEFRKTGKVHDGEPVYALGDSYLYTVGCESVNCDDLDAEAAEGAKERKGAASEATPSPGAASLVDHLDPQAPKADRRTLTADP